MLMWPSWSKALDLGSSPQGREFKSHCQQIFFYIFSLIGYEGAEIPITVLLDKKSHENDQQSVEY